MLGLKRIDQRVNVHNGPTRGIDEMRAPLHSRQLGGADHPMSLWSLRYVKGDEIGRFQQYIEGMRGPSVAERQLGLDIVIDDLHSQGFGKQSNLSSDVTVTDNA